jgi:hypothetical protein
MAKWADYCISAVRYDGSHIERVRVHEDDGGDSIGSYTEWARSRVVSSIDGGKTFVTITKNSDGKWCKGKSVHVIKVNGVKYIRTDGNAKESDNLESLPEF